MRRIALCITEDWFTLSHFRPLIRALLAIAPEVVVITRDSGRAGEIEALGARVYPFDYHRGSINPMQGARVAKALATALEDLRPDAVHAVSLKPITLATLALRRWPDVPLMIHVTGIGLLATQASWKSRVILKTVMATVAFALDRPLVHVLVENEDDLAMVAAEARDPRGRASVLGGAGVDPDHFQALADPPLGKPRVAYVGRMVRSKGLDVLIDAARLLRAAAFEVPLDLYGPIDRDNREAFGEAEIRGWEREGLVEWHGPVPDVRDVWRNAAVFVMAPRGGEGMPRSMLEAAACARPLIVTDVPGCRQFVRHKVEGYVVPPGRPTKLAAAMARLTEDRDLRGTMGRAARARVLEGYTERHVEETVRAAYGRLMGASR
jgi:glycosyltransferase involved in cell wall biosynthesis